PRTDRAEVELLFGDLARPGRRLVSDRLAHVFGSEQQAAAERVARGFLPSERLVELVAAFVAPTHRRAGFERQARVAGAVCVDLGSDAIEMFGLVAARHHALDLSIFDFGGVNGGVE